MRKLTVLITGANRGVGKEAAIEIAKKGAKVILACRNVDLGKITAQEISTATGNNEILVKQLDLNSLKSVRALADDILKTEDRLDVLVNNAGAFAKTKQLTEDGIESTFSSNYLGPFLLTTLLLPLLKKSAPSRIVMTTSLLYIHGYVDFENLNSEKGFSTTGSYSTAKLCIVMFSRSLQDRLIGTGVTVNTLHPGLIMTDLLQNSNKCLLSILKMLPFLWITAEEAGASTARLAISDELNGVSGKLFWGKKGISETPQACNKEVAKKLWSVSETLCGLNTG